VSKYLDAGGPKLVALRKAVEVDPVLHELTQTPLMLSIMSLAYQGAGRVELAAQSGASLNERRKQIFKPSTSTLSRCFTKGDRLQDRLSCVSEGKDDRMVRMAGWEDEGTFAV
jgi:hypothetical protein